MTAKVRHQLVAEPYHMVRFFGTAPPAPMRAAGTWGWALGRRGRLLADDRGLRLLRQLEEDRRLRVERGRGEGDDVTARQGDGRHDDARAHAEPVGEQVLAPREGPKRDARLSVAAGQMQLVVTLTV